MHFCFIDLEAGTPAVTGARVDGLLKIPIVTGSAQGEELSSSDEKPGQVPHDGSTPAGKPAKGDVSRDRDMGEALRSVYQRAVDEKVPDDLMDLLGKLG